MSQNPTLTPRQRDILQIARTTGGVEVIDLASTFEVTEQTIRRDLNRLCSLLLLQRTHGGANLHRGVENLGYEARKQLAPEAKRAIGRTAADLIPDDASLFINIGTTTEQVATELTGHRGLLVITNNIHVVNTLREREQIDVMTACGIVRREDGGIVGDSTTEFIDQFKVDFAVIGASALEADGTILDFDMREVVVARAIIRNARSVILVADAGKFDRKAPARIANIAAIDYFVTDAPPPQDFQRICREQNVKVIIAPQGARPVEHHGNRT